jgi:hypothetical protein
MTQQFSDRVKVLAGYADSKGIAWKADSAKLPDGDHIAQLGLLAHRLGVPFSVALDESLTKVDIDKLKMEG